MEIKPVERSRLAQSISASLLEMIKSNQLRPGQKIPTEIELAAAFDVSRKNSYPPFMDRSSRRKPSISLWKKAFSAIRLGTKKY